MRTRADLLSALERLRQRAARGSGRGRASLESIARATGIPRSTVHSYVRGLRLPPPDALDAIVVALGATAAEQAQWAAALDRVADARSSPESRWRPAVPRQLPARPAGFVGRERELAELAAAVERAGASEEAPAVIAVTGIGGVGKTALVLHWAHRSAHLFPDGELWIDLRAFSASEALEPADALERLLRAVGVGTAELPADVDSRAAMFRSAVAGRRMLLVVDNARDSEHVRPLLPGTPGFVTVVTSRNDLRSLVAREGAHRVHVNRFALPEALALLSAALPSATFGEDVAARIAARCDGLPLALRIVRERLLRAVPGDVERLAAELEGEGPARLAVLQLDDSADETSVRAVMEWSYRGLPGPTASLFRRLPLCLAATFDRSAAQALVGSDAEQTRRLLDQLLAANLLDAAGPDQFRVHDLVAAFATERLRNEERADEVQAARLRLYEYLIESLEAVLRASDDLRPLRVARPADGGPAEGAPTVATFADPAAAHRWVVAHTDMVLAAVLDAARHAPLGFCWAMAERAWRAMWLHGNVGVVEPGLRAVVESARTAGASEVERVAWRLLAIGYAHTARVADSVRAFEEAIASADREGDQHSVRLDRANLANLRALSGDVSWAAAALAEFVAATDEGDSVQFPALTTLVEIELQRGDPAAAWSYGQRAATVAAGAPPMELEVDVLLGWVELERGDLRPALARLTDAVARCRAGGDRQVLCLALERLAVVHSELAELGAAEAIAREALATAEQIGLRRREIDAAATLADVLRAAGEPQDALELCEDALAWSHEASVKFAECRTLVVAARARRDLGDLPGARTDARAALAIAERSGYRPLRDVAARLIGDRAAPGNRPSRPDPTGWA